ncbi:Hypothetical protein CINCED_3A012495 [Cinara cedri]|uniref:Type VII secretion system protein EssD-like domain-containing protein n=1 Tax=Cinara cedri TaxID=506608 RepID=A0A5E4NHV5_9HEMI|nr:Hypothetical protein CINCED_3A012495 [Cinara cedri]
MMFVAFVVLFEAVSLASASTTTPYTLIGRNSVTVTESQATCKNGVSTTVTTAVKGELYVLNPPGTRTDFTGNQWKNRMTLLDREPDDEQGHVVASVFGGPIAQWNLVPQHRSVNRKIKVQSDLLNRWDEFEKWGRVELAKIGGAPVKFNMIIKYAPANGCRPIGFVIHGTSPKSSGFDAEFVNGPNGTFAASSVPSKRQKKT